MSQSLQAVRGMNDLLPGDSGHWQQLETVLRDTLRQYGYQEIRLPIVEKTELFARAIGEVTDIVEKEMYTFEDRNGDSLTLRPEGTAGVVRAGIEHGLFHNQQQRLWYTGPMFRHERPQKGRYRQFHQVGVEAFGYDGPDIDAELILMTARLWRQLGITGLRLELNSLGTPEARHAYRDKLVDYFEQHRAALDEDSLRRLEHNPLRILDSKNPDLRQIIKQAPSLADHLDAGSREHFERMCRLLDDNDIQYEVNPRLVRGLDYYSRTVFEWITEDLGAQGAVCAGGRYDGLVEQLGGKPTPAIGFAMGIERLIELMKVQQLFRPAAAADAYLVLLGEAAEYNGMQLAESLRSAGLDIVCHHGGGSMKSQMKKADRSGARYALLLGEDELTDGTVVVKDLRGDEGQDTVAVDRLADTLQNRAAGE